MIDVYFEVFRTKDLSLLCELKEGETLPDEKILKDAWMKISDDLPPGAYDMKERNLSLRCWETYSKWLDDKYHNRTIDDMNYNRAFASYRDYVSEKIGAFTFSEMYTVAIYNMNEDIDFCQKLVQFHDIKFESVNYFYKVLKSKITDWNELLKYRIHVLDLLSVVKQNNDNFDNYTKEIANIENVLGNGQINEKNTSVAKYFNYKEIAKEKVKSLERQKNKK